MIRNPIQRYTTANDPILHNTMTDTTPHFNYSDNPGGGVGFAMARQKLKLEPFGQNYKIWTDSAFINQSFDQMVELVRQMLKELVDTTLFETVMEQGFQLGAESANVVRTDIEMNTISISINTGVGPVLTFFAYLEDDGYDYDCDTVETKANVSEVNVFNLNVSGEERLVDETIRMFEIKKRAIIREHKNALIRWYIPASHGGLKDINFQLKKDWVLEAEHYPWIKSDLLSYYKAFKESRSQIMVLYGEPGTGKTSFIRDMICELNLNSIISYDLKVITSDTTFVKYLSDKNFDAIIIEDADELLTSARGDYNKIISKILNVSDGLIKLPRKKLIFTTNLANLTDLDPAIIRPGRCFDVMEFRAFTQEEALIAAEKLGIDLSAEERAKKKMTIAELYAIKESHDNKDPMALNNQVKRQAFGFI